MLLFSQKGDTELHKKPTALDNLSDMQSDIRDKLKTHQVELPRLGAEQKHADYLNEKIIVARCVIHGETRTSSWRLILVSVCRQICWSHGLV